MAPGLGDMFVFDCFRGEKNLPDSLGGGDFKDVCLLNFDPHPVFGPWDREVILI